MDGGPHGQSRSHSHSGYRHGAGEKGSRMSRPGSSQSTTGMSPVASARRNGGGRKPYGARLAVSSPGGSWISPVSNSARLVGLMTMVAFQAVRFEVSDEREVGSCVFAPRFDGRGVIRASGLLGGV